MAAVETAVANAKLPREDSRQGDSRQGESQRRECSAGVADEKAPLPSGEGLG